MDTHEASIYTAVIIIAIVLGSTIIFFAISVFRQQRKFINMQRMYFSSDINLLEDERHRVARDLHDELGPNLSLSRSHINEIITADQKNRAHIKKASEYLFAVMAKMGHIARNLAPGALEKKGLFFTINDFLDGLAEISTIKFQFIYEVKSSTELNTSIHLYRIVQELGHNAIKHSKATMVEIHFKERGNKIYLYYKDNGIGFNNYEISSNPNGMGLGSLKSRTELLGGKMSFQSSSQKGTMYFFEFPTKTR